MPRDHFRFDATFRDLLQGKPRHLLKRLGMHDVVRLLPNEYGNTRPRRLDYPVMLRGGRPGQLEVHSKNEDDVNWRMLEYCVILKRELGVVPYQHLLYVGNEPLRMKNYIRTERLSYSFDMTDIRTIPAEEMLASDSLEDNLLAVLCRTADPKDVLRKTARKMRKRCKDQQVGLTRLMILCELRRLPLADVEEAIEMPVTVDLFKVPILGESARKLQQEAAAKGRAEGLAEGMAEGLAEGMAGGLVAGEIAILTRQIEKRFGRLPKWAVKRIKSAGPEEVEAMSLRLLDARSLKEVLSGE
jgi:hypothetical protein